jgi:hypothetical protein
MHQYNDIDAVKTWVNDHRTMIILSATDSDIKRIKSVYDSLGLAYMGFNEPDMSNIETAVAFEPVKNKDSKNIFSNLGLLK